MSGPIRIFIGTEPKTEIARKVLEHSIRVHTKADVEFTPMIGPDWEYPTAGLKVGTGFSLRRWLIPAHCGYKGRAIYLDADQLVFGDIAQLWETPELRPGPAAWCTYQADKFSGGDLWPQTSVMVIDCKRAAEEEFFALDKILTRLRADGTLKAYQRLMHGLLLRTPPGHLPVEWNHLDRYHRGKTRLVHYTSVPNQPWYNPHGPLAPPWWDALHQASLDRAVTKSEIEAACAAFGKDGRGEPTGLHPWYLKYARDR